MGGKRKRRGRRGLRVKEGKGEGRKGEQDARKVLFHIDTDILAEPRDQTAKRGSVDEKGKQLIKRAKGRSRLAFN